MLKEMKNAVESVKPSFDAIKWEDPIVYANWLSQSYYIASKSTAFLGLCLIHSEKYPEYQKRCTEHLREETGHEKLVLNDLKRLGSELWLELPETMAFYQPQYYQIVRQYPLAFMGYVFFLELLAPEVCPNIIERVTNKKALSFVKVHGVSDVDHIEKAVKILETMPDDLRELAMANFSMSYVSYKSMLKKVAELNTNADGSQALYKSVG